MIRPIYTYGEPILEKEAEDIDLDDQSLDVIIKDMFETMYNAEGLGLAAPQIGISKKIIVIDEKDILKGVFINARILRYLGPLSKMEEGCLSFPSLETNIIRPIASEIEWYDENKNYHKEIIVGIKSRILQHEIDHINGLLITDRMDEQEKNEKLGQLKDIKNKKFQIKKRYDTNF